MIPLCRRLATTLLLSAAVCSFGPASSAMAEFKMTILHTNDVHSRIEPINKAGSTCGAKDQAAKACFGGMARLATAIARERAASATSLLLDGGDQFQGSLFYSFYKGKDTAEFMNRFGYEAMTVGNHEFDDGPKVLEDFAGAVRFPLLMANADLSREPALARLIPASTVVEKNGERIGIIGLTPQNNQELTSAGKTIAFLDPVETVRREVAALTGQGIDKIIVLSHSGYIEDQAIAAAVDGVDVIVGGHSHTLLSNTEKPVAGPYPTMVKSPDGHDVAIVQAGSYSRYLGRLDVTFDDNGVLTAASGDPILLDASIPEDPEVAARVAELARPLAEIRDKVVAETSGPIEAETCRLGECAMGVLVADAMLDRVKDEGISIAIANGGGLRASIDAGPVTMGEVLTVLPFQNTLSTFKLKGSEIVEALENGVGKVEEGSGRFPQVAGLQFDWSARGEAGKSRIEAVRVKSGDAWVPIDPAASYGVVSNNFMRGGGDGYAVFAEKATDAYDFGPTLDAVVVDYLAKQGAPYAPHTDGRIKLIP